jgi:hypothetical protein
MSWAARQTSSWGEPSARRSGHDAERQEQRRARLDSRGLCAVLEARCRLCRGLRPPQGATPRPTGAPPMRPTSSPSPFPGQTAATNPAARWALSRPRSAERSEGSLDRRSPPGRYTLVPPGRAGVCCLLGAPWGADGSAGTARSERKPRGVCGWSARTVTAPGGGGQNSGMGALRSQAEAVPGWSARRAPHRTRSASQQSPREGDGGREELMGTGGAGAYRLAPWGADGAEQGARV